MISCSIVKTQSYQVGFDGAFKFRGLGELCVEFGDEARHLFREGFAVVFDFFCTHITAWREDVTMCSNFSGGGGFAEARDVGV